MKLYEQKQKTMGCSPFPKFDQIIKNKSKNMS